MFRKAIALTIWVIKHPVASYRIGDEFVKKHLLLVSWCYFALAAAFISLAIPPLVTGKLLDEIWSKYRVPRMSHEWLVQVIGLFALGLCSLFVAIVARIHAKKEPCKAELPSSSNKIQPAKKK